MSDNCPRCGSPPHESTIGNEVRNWYCGIYRAESLNLYESDLCNERQEKRIACEQLEELSKDFAAMQERAEEAEAELAKREKALIAAEAVFAAQGVHFIQWYLENTAKYGKRFGANLPTLPNVEELEALADWLKARQE